jgi:OOP family OmpA-OmpF porin
MIRTIALLLGAALVGAPGLGRAAPLSLPEGAILQLQDGEPAGSYQMPVAAWTDSAGIPTLATSGHVTRQAWRLGGTGLSTYQILLTLRQQLLNDGYEVLFECSDADCGGFDFRFGTDVISEPAMHVDLGDFYYLAAQKPGDEVDAVSLIISRSVSAGFVQIVRVSPIAALPAVPLTSSKAEPDAAMPVALTGEIGPAMEAAGRFILGDLVFATGSADLGPGDYASLRELAEYLRDHPGKRVALVGHTDATGSLAGNIGLSERRARSVLARLVAEYGVPKEQLEAEGIGYLAPIASNQTDEGRTLNRRVEAILVSTE